MEGAEGDLDIKGFGCNVASETFVKETFEEVLTHFGHLDAVIASAGKSYTSSFSLCPYTLIHGFYFLL